MIGFVCIDNMQGGFTSDLGFDIVASYADSLYSLFVMVDIWVEQYKKIEGENGNNEE